MLRAWFVRRLDELKVDPMKNLAEMLNNQEVDDEIKANINLQLLKLLVPAAPKELIADIKGEGQRQVVVNDYYRIEMGSRTSEMIEANEADLSGKEIVEVADV